MNQDTQVLIHEMNFAYLLLIQRLLAEDRSTAMSTLGVSPEVADVLVTLSLQELTKLAAVSKRVLVIRRGQVGDEIPREHLGNLDIMSQYASGYA